MTTIRNKFSPRKAVKLDTSGDKGRTRQEFKAECDIQTILKGFGVTGTVRHVMRDPGEYGYATGLDFREATELVRKAQEAFMELPSGLRARFRNDPAEFLEFTAKEENRAEMEKLGLIRPKAEPPKATPTPPPSA